MPLLDVKGRRAALQFVRFVIVGIVNTAFSYAIYAALLYAGMNFAAANLTALVVGILFSFKTQGALVFGNEGNRRLVRFVLVWSLIYAVNLFLITRFMALGFDSYTSGALAVPFATVLSYLAQKFFVFRPSMTEPDA